jgi:hypothetical protein
MLLVRAALDIAGRRLRGGGWLVGRVGRMRAHRTASAAPVRGRRSGQVRGNYQIGASRTARGAGAGHTQSGRSASWVRSVRHAGLRAGFRGLGGGPIVVHDSILPPARCTRLARLAPGHCPVTPTPRWPPHWWLHRCVAGQSRCTWEQQPRKPAWRCPRWRQWESRPSTAAAIRHGAIGGVHPRPVSGHLRRTLQPFAGLDASHASRPASRQAAAHARRSVEERDAMTGEGQLPPRWGDIGMGVDKDHASDCRVRAGSRRLPCQDRTHNLQYART